VILPVNTTFGFFKIAIWNLKLIVKCITIYHWYCEVV
jgi:hypothetical protein